MSNFPMGGHSCSKEPMEYCGETNAAGLTNQAITTTMEHLIPLDFTYVTYDSTTHHSVILAYLTFLPIIVGIGIITAILVRRDLEACYHSCGLFISTIINHLIKKIVRQPRPLGSAKLGHGMPSDHAQFSFFFVVYFSYWLIHRARMPRVQKQIWTLFMLTMAGIVCWSRIHLGVHTTEQVVAGSVIGAVLGLIWGSFARMLVWKHLFPKIERSALGRWFYLKDCSVLPAGVLTSHQFEYQCYLALREQHKQKANGTNGQQESTIKQH